MSLKGLACSTIIGLSTTSQRRELEKALEPAKENSFRYAQIKTYVERLEEEGIEFIDPEEKDALKKLDKIISQTSG
ncbi:MAG: hypothetical protein QXL13_05270 [Nitrososphaerota archaeon]